MGYNELDRWTRIGYERGMRSRKRRAVKPICVHVVSKAEDCRD
jgi:hypothetical protein